MTVELAGVERAHYLCDGCDRVVGKKGRIVAAEGFVIVARCPSCAAHRVRTRRAQAPTR